MEYVSLYIIQGARKLKYFVWFVFVYILLLLLSDYYMDLEGDYKCVL
jgi:hypothetical protein